MKTTPNADNRKSVDLIIFDIYIKWQGVDKQMLKYNAHLQLQQRSEAEWVESGSLEYFFFIKNYFFLVKPVWVKSCVGILFAFSDLESPTTWTIKLYGFTENP